MQMMDNDTAENMQMMDMMIGVKASKVLTKVVMIIFVLGMIVPTRASVMVIMCTIMYSFYV